MSVISCNEIKDGRSSSEGKDFNRDYTRTFLVITSSPLDDSIVVRSDPRVPRRGDIYSVPIENGLVSYDQYSQCVSTEASQKDDPCVWHVVCKYSTDVGLNLENPATERTKTSWTTEWIEKAIAWDLDDNYILNSAYDTFETPATIRVPIRVIRKKCTRRSYTEADDYDPFINRTNSVTFLGYAIGQVLLDDITVSDVIKGGVIYYEFDYTFKARKDETSPWNYKPLDMGYNTWDVDTERQSKILTREGQPINKPRLLDGFGTLLNVWDDPPANPVYLDFRLNGTADFNQISFP